MYNKFDFKHWYSFGFSLHKSSILNLKGLSSSGFNFSPLHFQILHTKYEYMVYCKKFIKKIKAIY